MTSDSSIVAPATRLGAGVQPVRLKSVALPVEHGGWGMLGELAAPLALAYGVAFVLLTAPGYASGF